MLMVAETWAAWMTNGIDGGDNEKGKQKNARQHVSSEP